MYRMGRWPSCHIAGGRDSQAMYQVVKQYFPDDQIIIVHANLGEVEWDGVLDHIRSNVDGKKVNVVQNEKRDFLQMVEERGMWPSPSFRTCTSDLKTSPIRKFMRQKMSERNAVVAYNCMGLRAEESANRAKKAILSVNVELTYKDVSKRLVYDFNPIFEMLTGEVFETIRDAGQKAFWAYKRNERLSCVFCIMGSSNDLIHGAMQRPQLYARYCATEIAIGHTIFMKDSGYKKDNKSFRVPEPLYEKVGIEPDWNLVHQFVEEIETRLTERVKAEASERVAYFDTQLTRLKAEMDRMITVQVEMF